MRHAFKLDIPETNWRASLKRNALFTALRSPFVVHGDNVFCKFRDFVWSRPTFNTFVAYDLSRICVSTYLFLLFLFSFFFSFFFFLRDAYDSDCDPAVELKIGTVFFSPSSFNYLFLDQNIKRKDFPRLLNIVFRQNSFDSKISYNSWRFVEVEIISWKYGVILICRWNKYLWEDKIKDAVFFSIFQ